MRREFRVVVCFYVVVGLILSVPFLSLLKTFFDVKREREKKERKFFLLGGGEEEERTRKEEKKHQHPSTYKINNAENIE